MRVEKLYDKISAEYRDFDYHNILAKSNQKTLAVIESLGILKTSLSHKDKLATPTVLQFIDLGVGDGHLLKMLQQKYPNIKLTGLDISSKMLTVARQQVEFTAIHAGVEEATHRLVPNSFDLATANFICAYVGLDKILSQANVILKPGGFIAITTSTFESFRNLQKHIIKTAHSKNLLRRYVGKRILQAIKSTKVPTNLPDIINTAQQFGFIVKDNQTSITEIQVDNGKDFLETAKRGGWIVTLFEKSRLPNRVLYAITKTLIRTIPIPFKDKCIIEIVLLQKAQDK